MMSLKRAWSREVTRIAGKLLLVAGLLLSLSSAPVLAEELDIVNRPVNTSGLTGLLFTTAPYTLPPGTVELGASLVSENSTTPNYSLTEFPLTITVGLTKNSELALRGSYIQIKEGPTSTAQTERTTGDLELSYKWNFLPQPEDSIRPALALIIGGILPTEKNYDAKISAVIHWGMRLGLSGGTEIRWKDHILGIYADAQMKGQDLSQKSLGDMYETYNAGLLFPLSKYQNLQMFIEYTLVTGKKSTNAVGNKTLNGGNYSGLTYGIRLVSEQFNLTIGAQFLRKETEGYDNSGKVIALVSMKF
jgi:hypothetical protein